ncbi:MAG: hypothetical protein JST30_12110 [Armatimonadetes bacterium]|nr:hypothetical protein [Armatimonadota bacterium]
MMFRTWAFAVAMLVTLVGCSSKPEPGVKIEDPTKRSDQSEVKSSTGPGETSEPQAKGLVRDSVPRDPSKSPASQAKLEAEESPKVREAAKDLEDMGYYAYPAADVKEGAYRTDSSAGATVGSTWTTPDEIEIVTKHLSAGLNLTAKSGVKRPESETRLLSGTTKSGNKVTLSIIREKDAKVTQIQVTVTGRPKG